jgi:signal transduction histidine kinase
MASATSSLRRSIAVLDLRELAGAIGETAVLPTIGHELRTPLTSICGYLETVLEDDLDAQTSRRFLRTAQREAQRMTTLIDALAHGALPVAASGGACNVAAQIRRVVETIAPLARRRLVTLRTTLPARAQAQVDADACIHALTNLIENAIKHGRTHGTVAVCCRHDDGTVNVTVDDDGAGVAPVAWSALFETGVRGKTQSEGNGIGLAIVRAIAQRAGGDVSIARSPLGGARFIMRLPAG